MRAGHQNNQEEGDFLQGISLVAENILTGIVVPENLIFCAALDISHTNFFKEKNSENIVFPRGMLFVSMFDIGQISDL